jgi:branched-chain amino acid transport system ATP-binding protein
MVEEIILKVQDLNKAFGGLQATNHVNYEMRTRELSAIIGPNGAGKSTFFNLLTGYHYADSGNIFFKGVNITNWPPHKIVRLGIARAFQVSNIFRGSPLTRMSGRLSSRSSKKHSIYLHRLTD